MLLTVLLCFGLITVNSSKTFATVRFSAVTATRDSTQETNPILNGRRLQSQESYESWPNYNKPCGCETIYAIEPYCRTCTVHPNLPYFHPYKYGCYNMETWFRDGPGDVYCLEDTVSRFDGTRYVQFLSSVEFNNSISFEEFEVITKDTYEAALENIHRQVALNSEIAAFANTAGDLQGTQRDVLDAARQHFLDTLQLVETEGLRAANSRALRRSQESQTTTSPEGMSMRVLAAKAFGDVSPVVFPPEGSIRTPDTAVVGTLTFVALGRRLLSCSAPAQDSAAEGREAGASKLKPVPLSKLHDQLRNEATPVVEVVTATFILPPLVQIEAGGVNPTKELLKIAEVVLTGQRCSPLRGWGSLDPWHDKSGYALLHAVTTRRDSFACTGFSPDLVTSVDHLFMLEPDTERERRSPTPPKTVPDDAATLAPDTLEQAIAASAWDFAASGTQNPETLDYTTTLLLQTPAGAFAAGGDTENDRVTPVLDPFPTAPVAADNPFCLRVRPGLRVVEQTLGRCTGWDIAEDGPEVPPNTPRPFANKQAAGWQRLTKVSVDPPELVGEPISDNQDITFPDDFPRVSISRRVLSGDNSGVSALRSWKYRTVIRDSSHGGLSGDVVCVSAFPLIQANSLIERAWKVQSELCQNTLEGATPVQQVGLQAAVVDWVALQYGNFNLDTTLYGENPLDPAYARDALADNEPAACWRNPAFSRSEVDPPALVDVATGIEWTPVSEFEALSRSSATQLARVQASQPVRARRISLVERISGGLGRPGMVLPYTSWVDVARHSLPPLSKLGGSLSTFTSSTTAINMRTPDYPEALSLLGFLRANGEYSYSNPFRMTWTGHLAVLAPPDYHGDDEDRATDFTSSVDASSTTVDTGSGTVLPWYATRILSRWDDSGGRLLYNITRAMQPGAYPQCSAAAASVACTSTGSNSCFHAVHNGTAIRYLAEPGVGGGENTFATECAWVARGPGGTASAFRALLNDSKIDVLENLGPDRDAIEAVRRSGAAVSETLEQQQEILGELETQYRKIRRSYSQYAINLDRLLVGLEASLELSRQLNDYIKALLDGFFTVDGSSGRLSPFVCPTSDHSAFCEFQSLLTRLGALLVFWAMALLVGVVVWFIVWALRTAQITNRCCVLNSRGSHQKKYKCDVKNVYEDCIKPRCLLAISTCFAAACKCCEKRVCTKGRKSGSHKRHYND
jgi:hypothetical protein